MNHRSRDRLVAGVVALLLLGGLAALSIAAISPPAAVGADAPPEQFSADRAYQHVQSIGSQVHPAGSAGAAEVRDYIMSTLTTIGLQPRIQEAVGADGALSGPYGMARVHNVVALLPGTASTGRVVMFAHYDSVQVSFGGNDDGAGVSTLLETARAVLAGPRPTNDIVFLFTDAEEACLCGAEAFVGQDPLAPGRRGGPELRVPRDHRPGDHVRDLAGQRRHRRCVRQRGALSGGHQLRRGGVPDPAERHRLLPVPGVRVVHRPEHRLYRRFRRLSHAGGQALHHGPGQPAAARRQRGGVGPRFRLRRHRGPRAAGRLRRHLLSRAGRARAVSRDSGLAACGARCAGRPGPDVPGPPTRPGQLATRGRRVGARRRAFRARPGRRATAVAGTGRAPARLREHDRPLVARLVPGLRGGVGRGDPVDLVRAAPPAGRAVAAGRSARSVCSPFSACCWRRPRRAAPTWRRCRRWPGRSAGWLPSRPARGWCG